jgi:hypothetical protein
MKRGDRAHTPIVGGILWLTAAHMAVCLIVFIFWRIAGDNARIRLFFQYQGSLFFILCAAVELMLAWSAFRQFSVGEPMRKAWLLITFASFYRLLGYFFSKILNSETYINPVFVIFGARDPSFYQVCERFGLIVSGPLSMAVLAAGLFLILRVLRRLSILSRLCVIDYVLIFSVAGFTLRQIYEIALELQHPPHDLFKVLSWPSDLFLSVLLIEAILIRRSAVQTGWGLLAKSWGAFSLAILFTLLGDVGLWATTNHYYIPWPYSSFTWYIWFFASAAYALGPAYQVEAYRRAYREAKSASAGPTIPASISK